MKFTLSWLNDHLATKATLDDILALMLQAGLEVEEVVDPREKLAAFTVCKVKAAEPHSDADKLRVCTVDTVDGEKQIVCGAPNARAGMTAIYAPLGTFIPGLNFALDKKPRKIRGIESHGMMCSTKEIEAGEDHDGIADLDDSIPLGTPVADALGLNDPVIDFEVTPNRPDWLGVQGIARDLAAAGAGRFLHADVKKVVGTKECPVEIRLDAPEACPVFAGAVIVGVTNGPSPEWMQQRLKAVGIQPKSLLVDVTNYISLDRARPLHAYDAAKLAGPVVARLGRKGEVLEALERSPRGEFELTTALEAVAKQVAVVDVEGDWLDLGRPWDLLTANALLLARMESSIKGTVEEGVVLEGAVHVAAGAIIKAGSRIEGPVWVGPGATVGPNACIRGATMLGAGAKVGSASEVKNSILMDGAKAPHHNYVGDSILGRDCNLGSGTKVANLRHDGANVYAIIRGERVDSGLRKLGVILGDDVKTGINASLNVGTILGEGTIVGPGRVVSGSWAAGSRIL